MAGSLTLDEIDMRFELLVSEVDNHISRLSAIERQMSNDLNAMDDGMSQVSGISITDSDSDDRYDEEEQILRANEVLGIPSVRWDEWAGENENDDETVVSESTVPQQYTPFDYAVDNEDDSDTDTIVAKWSDPARSPRYRDIIRGDNYGRYADLDPFSLW